MNFTLASDDIQIIIHLVSALTAGAIIGLERSFHGRPAGFRTHALVCLASSLLMMVTMYQSRWIPGIPLETIRTDPTRMAQGIMTGIGFLGAGAIVKEGFAIRGLTTAASIWMISAIGIMIGMGYYLAAGAATFATFNINYVFRLIEGRMRLEFYAHFHVRLARSEALSETDLRAVLTDCGCEPSGMSYGLVGEGRWFEYQALIKTHDKDNLHRLAERLSAKPCVCEFGIAPRGD